MPGMVLKAFHTVFFAAGHDHFVLLPVDLQGSLGLAEQPLKQHTGEPGHLVDRAGQLVDPPGSAGAGEGDHIQFFQRHRQDGPADGVKFSVIAGEGELEQPVQKAGADILLHTVSGFIRQCYIGAIDSHFLHSSNQAILPLRSDPLWKRNVGERLEFCLGNVNFPRRRSKPIPPSDLLIDQKTAQGRPVRGGPAGNVMPRNSYRIPISPPSKPLIRLPRNGTISFQITINPTMTKAIHRIPVSKFFMGFLSYFLFFLTVTTAAMATAAIAATAITFPNIMISLSYFLFFFAMATIATTTMTTTAIMMILLSTFFLLSSFFQPYAADAGNAFLFLLCLWLSVWNACRIQGFCFSFHGIVFRKY